MDKERHDEEREPRIIDRRYRHDEDVDPQDPELEITPAEIPMQPPGSVAYLSREGALMLKDTLCADRKLMVGMSVEMAWLTQHPNSSPSTTENQFRKRLEFYTQLPADLRKVLWEHAENQVKTFLWRMCELGARVMVPFEQIEHASQEELAEMMAQAQEAANGRLDSLQGEDDTPDTDPGDQVVS